MVARALHLSLSLSCSRVHHEDSTFTVFHNAHTTIFGEYSELQDIIKEMMCPSTSINHDKSPNFKSSYHTNKMVDNGRLRIVYQHYNDMNIIHMMAVCSLML